MKTTLLKKLFFAVVIASLCSPHETQSFNYRRKYVGMFNWKDPKLDGIRFGNWGSRPFEYAWAAEIVDVYNKRVIDLGTGIPSQYNWFEYVVRELKPAFYAGIDYDGRIIPEQVNGENFEVKYMNMADLHYHDKTFDIAYCISTFEHIPYDIFVKSIMEAHRVLKDNGLLIITLDEEWDKDVTYNEHNGWNLLELDLVKRNLFKKGNRTFGLPEFLELIKEYFVLFQDDAVIDRKNGRIISKSDTFVYYTRDNRDKTIINSGLPTNSCVSYAVLKKK